MSTIPLYDTLVKLGIQNKDAREVVDNIANAKEVATKADLQTELLKLEIRLTNKMYAHTAFIVAIVGLMIKFL